MSNALAAIGAALITVAADAAETNELAWLKDFDDVVAQGETNAAAAFSAALKKNVPFVGTEIAAVTNGVLANLVTTVDNAAKTAFDAGIAAMRAEAAKLEAG